MMILMRSERPKRAFPLLLAAGLAVVALFLSGCYPAGPACGQSGDVVQGDEAPPGQGCTIFTVSHGDQVFFGGNGDWINFDSNYYWVDPGDSGYGAIYFGRPDNVQEGVNEKGLAYDANGLPLVPVNSHPERRPVYGSYASYPIQILQACATVEEVVAWVQSHRWHEAMHDQLHFADATGDAVVISAGPDGELAFTRKPAGDGYLVSTNFSLANAANGSYPCWRYARAEELLGEIGRSGELSAERAAAVLDAVHVATPNVWTIMSLVADLPRGLVYVYLFHQFDAPIVLNVADEIARAPDPGPLRDLFPAETVNRADQAYHRLTVTRPARCNVAGSAWPALVVVSLVALLLATKSGGGNRWIWTPVVTVLGPVGLLVRRVTTGRTRAGKPATWQRALVETAGDLPPYLFGTVLGLLTLLNLPGLAQSSVLQLLVDIGFPLGFGLLLYQGPLLARATRTLYLRMLWRRLPAAIISTNLALAGLLATALPLINLHLNTCPISGLTALLWWPIAVLGGLVGGLLLYAYHRWAVRRGFVAWSALPWRQEGERVDTPLVASPTWGQVWLWFALSWVALAAGIALGAVGAMLVGSMR